VRVICGDLTIDLDRRQVSLGRDDVRLSPKAYAFLQYLAERRPAAVSRQEIYDVLWPDVFVSDSNLATIVAEVRRALNDDAKEPRYVRTIFGFGYAFAADGSDPAEAPACCRLAGGDVELLLPLGETILGREMEQLRRHGVVSRAHAAVKIAADTATIEDLDSKNGTFVGGRRIRNATAIVDGDVVTLGKLRLIFRRIANAGTTLTADGTGIDER
jgi:DNA-binding winged helix-turn-helix (wHTH) protein